MSYLIGSRVKWVVTTLFVAANLIFFWSDISSTFSVHQKPSVLSQSASIQLFHRQEQENPKKVMLRSGFDSSRKLDNEVVAPGAVIETAKATESPEEEKVFRTATGGFISTILILLTAVAFIGNGAFLVYVFWLSK